MTDNEVNKSSYSHLTTTLNKRPRCFLKGKHIFVIDTDLSRMKGDRVRHLVADRNSSVSDDEGSEDRADGQVASYGRKRRHAEVE